MPYFYVNERGVIVPDTGSTKTEVENEYKAIFGADLIVDDESPEGLIINAEVEQRDSLSKNNADLANQINPNLAEGVFLDAIFALTDGQREDGVPSTFSTPPTVTGVNGTLIPEGSRAETVSGDIFETTADVTIGGSGTETVQFRSLEDADIQVEIGELNSILDEVLGWETVTNTVPATPGRERQSDQAARFLRRDTLALQGRSTAEAVFSNVRSVDDVLSLSFRENVTASTSVIDGVSIPAHSLYVCVDGGLDSEVGEALLESKSAGCGWTNGASATPVDVNVVEPISGQTYEVKFDRPDDVPTLCDVTASVGPSVLDPITAVKNAVLAYVNGQIPGERGFVVGSDVSPFEIAGAVTITTPEILVRTVLVSKFVDNDPQPMTIPIALFEKASLSSSNISVTIV